MMDICYGKWKWCAQCIHRVVNVEKQDGRVVGIDCCGVCPWSESWVYPSMDEKKSFSIGKWCPYYAEAMMEQLNGGEVE